MEEPIADPSNPAKMTPQQRRQEIAAILARGVLRLRQCRQNSHDSQPFRIAEKTSEIGQDRLDEGAKTSPHVLARSANRQVATGKT